MDRIPRSVLVADVRAFVTASDELKAGEVGGRSFGVGVALPLPIGALLDPKNFLSAIKIYFGLPFGYNDFRNEQKCRIRDEWQQQTEDDYRFVFVVFVSDGTQTERTNHTDQRHHRSDPRRLYFAYPDLSHVSAQVWRDTGQRWNDIWGQSAVTVIIDFKS